MKQFEGEDTEEEANDFECEDDDDLNFVGKYEMLEMQEEYLDERTTAQESAHNNPESGSDRAKDTGDRPNEAKDDNLREDGLPREYVLEYRALCREFDEICPDDTWIEMEKDLDDWAASIRDSKKS